MFRVLVVFLFAANTALVLSHNRYTPNHLVESRIIGGVETTIAKFPYEVKIRLLGEHRCGGSILKSNIVITTAQCLYGISPSLFTVIAGTSSRIFGGVQLYIKEVIVHDHFDSNSYDNDIALVVLNGHLDFSELIQPIDLASEDEVLRPGTKGHIAGWGVVDDDGYYADTLQYTQVAIIGTEECAEAYRQIRTVATSMICASGEKYGGTDICDGDFGSPLVVAGKVYGYASWGEGCAKPGYPRVFSNVGFLRNWINSKVK